DREQRRQQHERDHPERGDAKLLLSRLAHLPLLAPFFLRRYSPVGGTAMPRTRGRALRSITHVGNPASAVSPLCDTYGMMRVLLADDHRLMLDGIRRALDEDGGFGVVGETQNGAQV